MFAAGEEAIFTAFVLIDIDASLPCCSVFVIGLGLGAPLKRRSLGYVPLRLDLIQDDYSTST